LVAAAIARADAEGQVSVGRSWRRFHGRLLVQRGRLAEADVVLTGELREHVVAATPELARLALTVGEVARRTGDDRRSRLVAGIATDAPDEGGPIVRCLAIWLLAMQAEAANDSSTARELLVQLGPEREVARLPLLLAEPSIAPRLVRVATRVGLDAIAVGAATAALDLARRNPGARTIAAAAAHSRGLVDRDANALADAAELYGRTTLVLAEASALEDHGIELARHAERSAVDAFDRALRHYVRCGATWDASRVRGRLRALGVRRRLVVPTRPANVWGSLTTGELAVVRLVAEGLTNRAVARQLFLSSHTVGMHLRHVFLKLGINSRVELARRVLDHEHA
jgi:DNA-binding CsgD family transcriptional regulator